jgi:S-adenosylmethionine:tRNA ribosyltransferase-isomerase
MSIDLLLENYNFELPEELIAARPIPGRHHSKLLVYHQKEDRIEHRSFYELPDILPTQSHLVLNQSKVFPARLLGNKESGGAAELFFLSLIAQEGEYSVLIRTSGKKNLGLKLIFGLLEVNLTKIASDGTFLVKINLTHDQLIDFLSEHGQIPIPPYIREGKADAQDEVDYQTVYAKHLGSVAAPTAGLHFTPELFIKLKEQGIEKSFVTLHVGAGTFKPVTCDKITEHQMHLEHFMIEPTELAQINQHQGNLIAVGTTSLRVLESCVSPEDGKIRCAEGLQGTDIFLYPGKQIHSIAGLITNFHLPKSSLIMLVSSLIGRQKTLDIYKEAIKQNYRFFSYGDGMLILR